GTKSGNGSRTTTRRARTRRSAIGPLRSSRKTRRRRAVEKTAAEPPWKTLRVSHFPPASAAARRNLRGLCSLTQTRRLSHYEWTKNGGQVSGYLLDSPDHNP